jgi:hypothetical protein
MEQLTSRCQKAVNEHVTLLQSFRLKGTTSMFQASIIAAKARWKQRFQVSAYWTTIGELLDLSIFNGLKLWDLIVGHPPSTPPDPTLFCLVLIYPAPRFIAAMLKRDPSLVTAQQNTRSPLLVTLRFHPNPESAQIFLDYGADPVAPSKGEQRGKHTWSAILSTQSGTAEGYLLALAS